MRLRTANSRRRAKQRRYAADLRLAKKRARIGTAYGMGVARFVEAMKATTLSAQQTVEAFEQVSRSMRRMRRLIRNPAVKVSLK